MTKIPNIQVYSADLDDSRPRMEQSGQIGLTSEQKEAVSEAMDGASMEEFRTAFKSITGAINKLGSIIGGFEGAGISIDYDPLSGKTQLSVDKQVVSEVAKEASSLPSTTGKTEGMALVLDAQLAPEWDNVLPLTTGKTAGMTLTLDSEIIPQWVQGWALPVVGSAGMYLKKTTTGEVWDYIRLM